MNLKKFNKNLKKEYEDTFNENRIVEKRSRFHFEFKIRYIFALVTLLFVCILIGEHISVSIYNSKIDRNEKAILNLENNELEQITSKKELNQKLKEVDIEKKTSTLSYIFSFQFISCENMAPVMDGATADSDIPLPENSIFGSDNSYDTNVQMLGLDEADSAKCDGTYIYAIIKNRLYVYDLLGECVTSIYTNSNQLYIYEDKIICLGNNSFNIYQFKENLLSLIYENSYSYYVDSRLTKNYLFITTSNYLNVDNVNYDNLYYDGCINPRYVYTLLKYDLDTNEYCEIELLNSYNAILYASETYFYLASNNYVNGKQVTFISIVDYNMNPKGVIKLEGSVLNQFSMDEYNDYFRIVTTDTTKALNEINAISIYDLDTLELVGFLNEGIGKDNQIVKSVRFDNDICYVVTYLNQDPLYEIDCSDVTNPTIVSQYEAPGYSSYLHTFKIKDNEYLFGLGYTDDGRIKLSVYHNDGDTTQIGNDLIIQEYYYSIDDEEYYYNVDYINYYYLSNHKALFIYNDNTYLYLGMMVGNSQYTIFKIDIENNEMPVSVYKEYKELNTDSKNTRGFLVNGKFYIPIVNDIIIDEWN